MIGKDEQSEYDFIDEDRDDYEYIQRSYKLRHIIITVAITLIVSIFCTWFVCRFTQDIRLARLSNENTRYETQIEQSEQNIKDLNSKLEKAETTIKQKDADLSGKDDLINELSKEIDKLEEELAETKEELQEAQFRADMYQKWGMWEW